MQVNTEINLGDPESIAFQQPARLAGGNLRRLGWVVFTASLAGCLFLFYFSGYRFLIANSSSSSTVELVRHKMLVSAPAQTLVIGNSVVAEGFLASAYNSVPGRSTPAVNLGIPSGHMFLYEKVLDMALDNGLHPSGVVLLLTPEIFTFSADPNYDFLKNDLTVMKVELTLGDVARLRHHSRSLSHYAEYAAPVVLRPALFTADLRDFAAHPIQRIKDSRFVYGWLHSMTAPESFPEPNNSFAVCAAEPLEELNKRITEERLKPDNAALPDLERVLNGYESRAGSGPYLKVDEFERERLTKLLMRFTEKVPNIYMVPAPYYDPRYVLYPAEYRAAFAESLLRLKQEVPSIHILPALPVNCNLMMDTVHLNRAGGEKFAAHLREEIERILAGAAPVSK